MMTILESIMLICFAVAMLLNARDRCRGNGTNAMFPIGMSLGSLAGLIGSCLKGFSLVSALYLVVLTCSLYALIVKGKGAHD